MKLRLFFLFLPLTIYLIRTIQCDGLGDIAVNTAVTTIVKEPIALVTKDVYEHLIKNPIKDAIHMITKMLKYRRILRWARIWWILLAREIVGKYGKIDQKTNKILRKVWEQCAIAVNNNSLNSVDAKPLLFLRATLIECKENFSTKLRNDPDMIVKKIDKILASGIYRFWVTCDYLKLGQSDIFYENIKPCQVPYVPEKYTLHYVSHYMEAKLKSLESKKDIDASKHAMVAVKS